MLIKPANRPVSARVVRKFMDFRSNEDGAMGVFVLVIFVFMMLFGGIAVDVMRFEMRRVALQETMDRATLAASNVVLPVTQSPESVALEWFNTSGIGGDEFTYEYTTPTITGDATTSSREAKITSKVRSYNWFMHMLDVPYFEGPTVSSAKQGVSKIEVIMVLDVTGSMSEASGSTTKIKALQEAASKFLTVLKFSADTDGEYTIPKDINNLISIGMVPYAAHVNVPVALRNQFTQLGDLSSWDGVANAGVPGINCIEIPEGTYDQTGLPTSTAMSMASVALVTKNEADPNTNTTADGATNGGVITLSKSTPPPLPTKNSNNVVCNHGDNFSTSGTDESASNLIAMPSTSIDALKLQVGDLNARGRTSIAVGMRWGTALLDETARDIYSAVIPAPAVGENTMAGRPADNNAADTRKIIVLMTDGDHVASNNVFAYKSGLSPIWRGASDGNLVIRYTNGGPALTDGLRPGLTANTNTCSGWVIGANREFFAPHLKATSLRVKNAPADPEGVGSGGSSTSVTGACDPRAWLSSATGTPSWTGSGTVRQLDWSEVWRYASVDWVVRQLYMRSGVAGTNNYNTVYDQFVAPYLGNDVYMDQLLERNCTAAKDEHIEVFGIVLGDAVNEAPVQNCSSPGTGYYYKVTSADDLSSAFEQIAVLISELRLTQ